MADVILDTNILSSFLAQFFNKMAGSNHTPFVEDLFLTEKIVREINNIADWHNSSYTTKKYPGLVIASSFGFVEIARKFHEISNGRFSIEQLAAFIEQPPEWFYISSVDNGMFGLLQRVPRQVEIAGKNKPIEWADAIHVATALGRDNGWLLAASDERIKAIPILRGHLL